MELIQSIDIHPNKKHTTKITVPQNIEKQIYTQHTNKVKRKHPKNLTLKLLHVPRSDQESSPTAAFDNEMGDGGRWTSVWYCWWKKSG